MDKSTCCLEGCSGKVHHRNLCGKHYRIAREKKILVSRGAIGPKMHCEVPGCVKPRRDGYKICRMHSHRKTRHGDTLGPAQTIADKRPMQVGATFGQLVVASYVGDGIWQCDCECGGSLSTTASNLHRGRAIKCGDDDAHFAPSYNRAHKRVRSTKGMASDKSCADCDQVAQHWSYNHSAPDVMYSNPAKRTFPFSMDPSHYSPRCVPCHSAFDAAIEPNESDRSKS